MKTLNKKGDEQILSIWMFIIWGIIAVGIITGAWLFYNSKADVRVLEINILNSRIADCLNNVDYNKPDFDLFIDCKIDKKMIEESEKYFINITIDKKSYDYGVLNFLNLCPLHDKNPKDFPVCIEKSYSIKNNKVIIFTGSNQWGAKL